MALQKQPVTINFAQGLDTKTDPNQVSIGKFLTLQNSVFDVAGRLTKRNGFPLLTTLPNEMQTTLTTLNGNLLATGSDLYAYNEDINQWFDKGTIQPVTLATLPMVRASTSQSSPDMAVAPSGLATLAYMDGGESYYQVSDTVTGQQVVPRTSLGATSTNPRVFLLSNYFIVTYMITISATPHLQYIAIPVGMPSNPGTPQDLSADVASITTGYDGIVANNNLFVSWTGSTTEIHTIKLSFTLVKSTVVSITSQSATLMSMVASTDSNLPTIWLAWWNSSGDNGYAAAYDQNLNPILAATQIITSTVLNEITSIVDGSSHLEVIYEVANVYGSTIGSVKTDFIDTLTVSLAGTILAGPTTILRSVGLASKPFKTTDGKIYMLAAYGETNQPTYFLIDDIGNIYMRLAYSNGGGYEASQVLPSVSSLNGNFLVPYLATDLLASVNKGTNNPAGTPSNAIFTQTGINLATFSINESGQYSSEIAGTLHLTGGQLWMFDGVRPVEHGFQVWPENMAAATTSTTGHLSAQIYFYAFTYEWTDNQGNLHRSAPSIPLEVDLSASMTSTNKVTLEVPTLRLTYKVAPNPVRIVGYRWSTAQQVYYQFTSLTSPTVNDPTVDYVTIVDTLDDASILGNTLLYTTGGVIEDIAAPASVSSALFKNRLFLIDAEDRNLIWFSKQVIDAVPVEMSDLLTLYIAPTSGAQGSTGPLTALSAMDDKLIMFKKDAIYYLTGIGPDNTGANNDFTDPVYITSSVGCANPNSIVLMPQGLMFQSDKGIWLLGRDLSTNYIGAPVEAFNNETVLSAQAIPATNQIRFILPGGITLMYDYYYQQWGTFTNLRAISGTLYQGFHTYLNEFGAVYKETPGTYIDGSTPVLMSFSTGWINAAGLRGFERFYFLFMLGTYVTPFKLNVALSYDFNTSATQNIIVTPDNYIPNWGEDPVWGASSPWGGTGDVFQARLFPQTQKCQTFQIAMQEVYDSSFGVPAGQGLTLSGMNMVIGVKKGYPTQKASRSFG